MLSLIFSLCWLLLSQANVLPDKALAKVAFAFEMEILEDENIYYL